MAGILMAHRARSALEREEVAALGCALRGAGFEVFDTADAAGVGVGTIPELERQVAEAETVIFVDPGLWWLDVQEQDPWQRCLVSGRASIRSVEVEQRGGGRQAALGAPRFRVPQQWRELLTHLAGESGDRAGGSRPFPEQEDLHGWLEGNENHRRGQDREREIPLAIEALLDRTWAALHTLPRGTSQLVMRGLELLVAGRGELPRQLLATALAYPEPAGTALEVFALHADQWTRWDEPGVVRLLDPMVTSFLASQADPLDQGPHLHLARSLQALQRSGEVDPTTLRYADRRAHSCHVASRGIPVEEAWVLNTAALVGKAARGQLRTDLERVEAAAGERGEPLVREIRVALGRLDQRLADDPAELPVALWNGLVARGRDRGWMTATFSWPHEQPLLRLAGPLAHPDRALCRFFGHTDSVRGCSISADGGRVATISNDGSARVWSSRTGLQEFVFDAEGWADACALSADGQRLALGTGGERIRVWDLATGGQLGAVPLPADLSRMEMDEAGERIFAGDERGGVFVWDIGDPEARKLGEHGDRVTCVAMSGDGTLGVSGGSDKRVILWDLSAGAAKVELEQHPYRVGGVALNRDLELGISVGIGTGRAWSPETGETISTFEERGELTCGVAFIDMDRRVVSALTGTCVHRWFVDSGQIEHAHIAHGRDMLCLAASADGRYYVTGGEDGSARLWSVESPGPAVASVEWTMAVQVVVADEQRGGVWVSDSSTRLLDLAGDPSGTPRAESLELAGGDGYTALAHHDGRVYAVGSGPEVAVFDSRSGERVAEWAHGEDWRRCVAVDGARGRVAVGGDDSVIYCSDLSGDSVVEMRGHEGWIRGAAFLPDGRLASVCSRGGLHVWSADHQRCELELTRDSGLRCVVTVAREGVAIGTADGAIEVWDLKLAQRPVHTFAGHTAAVADLAVQAELLISASEDATVRVWSLANGRELARHVADYSLTSVTVAGKRIVTGDRVGNVVVLEVNWSRLATLAAT